MTDQAEVPPLDDLDGIFTLPESVDDPALRQMYEVLVIRLRRDLHEALVKAPSTIQLLVAERTAMNYILIKNAERHAIGSTGGFAHFTAAKEFNAFWMSLAETLNKMMRSGDAAYREALLVKVGQTISTVLQEAIPDETQRKVWRERIGADLASVGF